MKFFLLGTIVCSEVLAAGGTGHGGPADLIPSAVNVIILASLLIYLLKDKLKDFFTSKSVSIAEMMERAEIKAKEAEMMMKRQQEKISGAQAEIEKLQKDTENQISSFEGEYKVEVNERIEKMKEDAGQKIEAEKAAMMNNLNANLLDQVILQAKNKIKSEASLKSRTTESLVGEL